MRPRMGQQQVDEERRSAPGLGGPQKAVLVEASCAFEVEAIDPATRLGWATGRVKSETTLYSSEKSHVKNGGAREYGNDKRHAQAHVRWAHNIREDWVIAPMTAG